MVELELYNLLIKLNYKISFCESCTGGMLASTLINVSGSSKVIDESYVTYASSSKIKILGVKKETIEKYTVYSKEVAEEMVLGLNKLTNAEVCVSVTGLAESETNTCKCDYGILVNGNLHLESVILNGSRNEVRKLQTEHILKRISSILKGYIV